MPGRRSSILALGRILTRSRTCRVRGGSLRRREAGDGRGVSRSERVDEAVIMLVQGGRRSIKGEMG